MTDISIHTPQDDLAASGADLSQIEDYADVSVVQGGAAVGWEFTDKETASNFRRDLLELFAKYNLT